MATNLNTTDYERTRYAPMEQTDPPVFFQHSAPALPATPPDYPGWGTGAVYFNSYERAEIDRYLANPTPAVLASLRLYPAIAKAGEFQTYFATPAYQAWRASNFSTRRSMWKQFNADALINSKAAVSPSANASGSGSGTPPPPTQPPGTDVP